MGSNVFNELMKKDFMFGGVAKRLTKKGVDNLITTEMKDFIRSNPDVVLVGASVQPRGEQYLFTYKLARGEKGACHKTMTYISRYQLIGFFKEVENN